MNSPDVQKKAEVKSKTNYSYYKQNMRSFGIFN